MNAHDIRPITGPAPSLPGDPPDVLKTIWGRLSWPQQHALRPHLVGDTAADWVAGVLKDNGHKIGATTIKTYRRSLKGV